jgi:hypothetical protein
MPRARIALALTVLTVLTALAGAAGCANSRYFVFPTSELPTSTPRAELPRPAQTVPVRLALGEITVHVSPPTAVGRGRAVLPDWSVGRAQLQEYLERRLVSAPGPRVWVARGRDADYVVDVDVDILEQGSVNAWILLGVAIELGALGAGTGIGAAVGSAHSRNGALEGSLIGLGISIPVAIGAALAPPSSHVTGLMEAVVSLRRARDGVQVGLRHAEASWGADLSVYSGPGGEMARRSGASAAELATNVNLALQRALDDLPASTTHDGDAAPAAPAAPETLPTIEVPRQ